jgi:hypothetical protein
MHADQEECTQISTGQSGEWISGIASGRGPHRWPCGTGPLKIREIHQKVNQRAAPAPQPEKIPSPTHSYIETFPKSLDLSIFKADTSITKIQTKIPSHKPRLLCFFVIFVSLWCAFFPGSDPNPPVALCTTTPVSIGHSAVPGCYPTFTRLPRK